ncbi:MAG: hypothetical protein JW384_03508 [Nitrosomonadaceae bacterium]|nr:hypothetical protein [Nitrosomonadaceae bacterium]
MVFSVAILSGSSIVERKPIAGLSKRQGFTRALANRLGMSPRLNSQLTKGSAVLLYVLRSLRGGCVVGGEQLVILYQSLGARVADLGGNVV